MAISGTVGVFQSDSRIDGSETILICALAFGLSMNYEVFPLSPIKAQLDVTGDNRMCWAGWADRERRWHSMALPADCIAV